MRKIWNSLVTLMICDFAEDKVISKVGPIKSTGSVLLSLLVCFLSLVQ